MVNDRTVSLKAFEAYTRDVGRVALTMILWIP